MRENGKITKKDYQELSGVSRITASRELADLVEKKLLRKVGTVGRGTKYIL